MKSRNRGTTLNKCTACLCSAFTRQMTYESFERRVQSGNSALELTERVGILERLAHSLSLSLRLSLLPLERVMNGGHWNQAHRAITHCCNMPARRHYPCSSVVRLHKGQVCLTRLMRKSRESPDSTDPSKPREYHSGGGWKYELSSQFTCEARTLHVQALCLIVVVAEDSADADDSLRHGIKSSNSVLPDIGCQPAK
eukprot:62721-Amphidinium_carterae.1